MTENIKWDNIIPEYGLIGILGKRGTGKTALGYYLCELLHSQIGRHAVVYGPGVEILEYLPDYFLVMNDLSEIGNYINHIVFIDEGSIPLHIRRAMSTGHVMFDQAISLCRHRNQLLIICSHHSAKLDVLVIRDMDIVAFKQPSKIHTQMERQFIQSLSLKAWECFRSIPVAERKRATYVFWDDFDHDSKVDNDLPSFWNEQISKAVGLSTNVFADDNFKQTLNEVYRFLYQIRVECGKEDEVLDKDLGKVTTLVEPYTYDNPMPAAEDMLVINKAMDNCLIRDTKWSKKLNYAKNLLRGLTRQIEI